MKNTLESKVVRTILWVLGGLIVLFLVFGLGLSLGYRRAGFEAGFSENYARNFPGGPGGMAGMMGGAMPIHGAVGTVIDITTSTISLQDDDGDEHFVLVASGTPVREGEQTFALADIKAGEGIAVIGAPNDQGQIVARFIRVFPASSSMPMPPEPQSH